MSGYKKERHNVLVVEREQLQCTWGIPPVPHQVARNSEHGHDLDTRRAHALIRVGGDLVVQSTRGLCVRKDGVAFFH